MPADMAHDKSNGYEAIADAFMRERDPVTGVGVIVEWSRVLAAGASVLDLGCGHGVPIARALIERGFSVYGVDASPTLVSAFRRNFPGSEAECASVEESKFFDREFDGVVVSGLMFLLAAEAQELLLEKVAGALRPGGRLIFMAPEETGRWRDLLTGLESTSLGFERYEKAIRAAGLTLAGQKCDEGQNHYYLVSKPQAGAGSI